MAAGMKLENMDQAMKALERMEGKIAKKVLRRAMRASIKRVREKVAAATPVDTGKLRRAMATAPIRTVATKRGTLGIGLMLPTRAALGIPAESKSYYPAVVEYGSAKRRLPARSFLRHTVDTNISAEHALLADDIAKDINMEAKRASR